MSKGNQLGHSQYGKNIDYFDTISLPNLNKASVHCYSCGKTESLHKKSTTFPGFKFFFSNRKGFGNDFIGKNAWSINEIACRLVSYPICI